MNAFNRLNRKAALSNALNICLVIGTILLNTYRSGPCLFIECETIMSNEGTTQRDPLVMAVYIRRCHITSHQTTECHH